METPKPKGGRPRRRPFAAHDARAVKLRAANAASWLMQLRWCLDGHPEVLNHWLMTRPADHLYWRRNEGALVEMLQRLITSLDDPIAVDEGQADG